MVFEYSHFLTAMLVVLVAIVLLLNAVALVRVFRSDHDGPLSAVLWVLLPLVLPVVGAGAALVVLGKPRSVVAG